MAPYLRLTRSVQEVHLWNLGSLAYCGVHLLDGSLAHHGLLDNYGSLSNGGALLIHGSFNLVGALSVEGSLLERWCYQLAWLVRTGWCACRIGLVQRTGVRS